MIWLEGLKMALGAIGAHKLRSALTLVGIIAGVAAIIAVMTGVSVIQTQMEAELSVLGSRVFQAQKYPPFGFEDHNNRNFREIQRWPPLTVEHADLIREKVRTADLVGAELWQFSVRASFRGETTEPVNMICGGTPVEYPENNTHYVELGRNISNEDVRVGRNVVVIGYQLAQSLFPFTDPVGNEIKVDGRKYTVQGVFAERKSAMGVRVWTTSGAFFCGVVTDTPDPALLRIATSSAKDKWTIADNYTITTIDSRAVVAYIAEEPPAN